MPPLVADPGRLAALDALAVLDTPAEQGFDDVVRLAARLCAAPVALVSLVAHERQWFKARVGFPHCETDLDRSVCKFVLAEPDLLVIPDLAGDPRTAANPLVTGEPGIRFYAGAPLRTPEGHALGSLCVIDTHPRLEGLAPEQADDLRALGRQVSGLLAMRRAVEHREEVLERQRAELRRARRADIVAKAAAALAVARDPAAVLEPILAEGAASVGFEQCFIYDLAPDREHLHLARSVGASEAVRAALARAHLDGPLCGIVVRTRAPVVFADVQASAEPRYAMAREAGINAFAGYPILSRGGLVGVVSFTTAAPRFDAEALAFFETLARLISGVRERLDGEAALRESDARSRRAQAAGQVGTFEVDVAAGLMSVSDEFARLYGMPPTGLYSPEAFEALVLPEDRHLASNEASREAGTAAPDVEYRIRRADDGAVRWIARRASFARDAAGRVTGMFGTVLDVTETREALRLLRENQERLRASDERLQMALAASGVVGLWDWMVDTDLLHGDANFARLYGLDVARSAAGITMEQYQEFVVPEDVGPLRAAIRDTFEHGADFLVEYRLTIPGEALRWVECKGRMIHDAAGTPVRFSGTAVDVTARKATETALRESQRDLDLERGLLRSVLEQAPVGISLAFADGRASFNARATQMLGHGPGEGDARYAAYHAVHADGRRYAPEEYPTLRALRRGEVVHDEPMRHRNAGSGEVRRWEISSAPIRDAAGAIVAAVSLFADVEDDLCAREALERSQERLSLALDATGSLGWYDWDIVQDRLYAGEFFARRFGVDPGRAAAGAPLADFVDGIHPDDRERVGALIARAISGETTFDAEYRLTAGGEVTWVRSLGRIYYDGAGDGAGRAVRFPGILIDITSAKQAALRREALLAFGDRLRDLTDGPALAGAAAEILARVTGAAQAGYGIVDAARETVEVLADWRAQDVASVAGLHGFRLYGASIEDLKRGEPVAVDDVTLDPRTRADAAALLGLGVRAFVNVPIIEHGRLVGLAFVHYAQPHALSRPELDFVRTVADRAQAALAKLRAEADQRVLNEELAHRLKNTLAMVLSIATQTLRGVPERAPIEAFERRIHALSQAHDVLLRQTWSAAPAKEVVRTVLAGAGHADRIDVSGPDLDLGPRATLSLSLLLHELATNAAKYGALSVPEGRVAVDWQLEGRGEGAEVALDWTERGGPPPVPPASTGRRGFGSRIIGLGLVGTGGVDLRYPASGFQATMRALLAQIQQS